MLRTLTYASLIFVLWALFARWYYACYIKGSCCDDIGLVSHVGNLRLTKDGSADILRGYNQFVFATNSEKPDISPDYQDFMKKTAEFLKINPLEKLLLTCCHRPSEDAALAEKRAAYLKAELVKFGASESQIQLSTCKDKENLLTPTYFALTGKKDGENIASLDKPIAKSVENTIFNMNISDENFAFNSAIFRPNPAFVNQANELKAYVATHPKIALSITGHTDNVGNDAYNLRLGQRRADAVKNYFNNLGIKVKITTDSKGEAEPIASNDTESGMAQNRRVNSKIIQ
jgi:OmpA-OmpF porin, OOP family